MSTYFFILRLRPGAHNDFLAIVFFLHVIIVLIQLIVIYRLHKQIYVVIDLAALILIFAVLLIVVTRSTQSTATCIDHSLARLSQARESTGASR